jgi:hypothetical protein
MSITLPARKNDDWLMCFDQSEANDFPLAAVLKDSLFYPASGLDDDPVKHLSSYTTSFVYCDYAMDEHKVDDARLCGWMSGYRVIMDRRLSREEVAPDGFRMPPLEPGDGDPNKHDASRKPEFIRWQIGEKLSGKTNSGEPQRVSLLYLGVDGVAAFNTLYVMRGLSPAAIAIIQPGHCFGNNYTNFEDPVAILSRLVLSNPAGAPDILMFGGNQDEAHYRSACWPRYRRLLARPERSQKGFLGIWTRRRLPL